MVVEKIINRRWAMLLHWGITIVGLVISLYVSMHTSFVVGIANLVCALALWYYSTTFKKKLLSGNLIISLLTAWTVMVLYFATGNITFLMERSSPSIFFAMSRIFKFAILYGGFAFIISLVREVVKDIEDMQGDAKYQCQTMPIVWGVPAAKVFAGVWLVVLIGALLIIQFYAFQLGWWMTSLYCLLLIITPLGFILRKLYQAQNSADYHQLSRLIKLTMLAGILSMLFFTMNF
jgi:4-hydroxybenzoate polyprenyltransferase